MRSEGNDRLHEAVREQGSERGEDSGTSSHGRRFTSQMNVVLGIGRVVRLVHLCVSFERRSSRKKVFSSDVRRRGHSETPRQQVRRPSHINVGLSAIVYRRIRWLVRMEGSEDGIFGLGCRLIGRWANMVQHRVFVQRES